MKLFDSLSGLVNRITGTGTERDKATQVTWHFKRPEDYELMHLYRSTWVAQKMINIPIDDMLREGWTWQADKVQTTKLENEERRLGLVDKLRQALIRDSLYGGAALIIGDGAADPSQELRPESIGLGGIKYLLVSGRGELLIRDFQLNPAADYRQPTMYEMLLGNGQTVRIHPSRVITFNGQPVEAPMSVLTDIDFWGDSRLASVMRDIAAAMSGVIGTGRLMDELAVTYHKVQGLIERLAEEGGEDAVQRVVELTNRMKSSINSAVVDGEDDVQVITASFAGLPETVRSLMQNVAGAADIPLTRFLGSSPDGLNATGASDVRNYYDRLAGRRAAYVEPGIRRLDEFLIRSALGTNNDNIWRIWNPLWQLTETEQVDLDGKKMEMMTKLAQAGIVHDHVVSEVLKAIMSDSPTFPGAETAFDEADKMPEPDPVEVETANSLQAGEGQPPARALLRVAGGTDVGDEQAMDDARTYNRHPAGTSKGGQFAPKGGAGGGGSEMPPALAALHSVATKKYSANAIALLTQKNPKDLSHYEKKVVAKYHKALKAHQVGAGGAPTKKPQPVAPAKPAVDPTLEAAKAIATSKYPPETILALTKKSPGELSQYEKKVVAKYNKQLKASAAEKNPDVAKVVPSKVAPSGVANPKGASYQELAQATASMTYAEQKGHHLKGVVNKTAEHQKGISTLHGLPVSDIEHRALLGYSGTDYESINKDLRAGKSLAAAGGSYVDVTAGAVSIQGAIKRHTLNDDSTFVRGVRPHGAAAMFPNGIKEGVIARDPGFVSVSRDVEIAAGFAGRSSGGAGYLVVVSAKRGQNVMPIREYSEIPHEDEFLLPAGSAMKVTRFDASTLTVYVDLLD